MYIYNFYYRSVIFICTIGHVKILLGATYYPKRCPRGYYNFGNKCQISAENYFSSSVA